MAQPTLIQSQQYQFHKFRCGLMRIPQSTLEHRSLMGTLSAPSSTGNTLYTGPGPSPTDLISTTTKVWAVTQPMVVRGGASYGSDTEFGRQSVPMMRGQCPAIDDNGNAVAVAHDDIFIDAAGLKFKIENPQVTPDNSLWSFNLTRLR